MADDSNMRVPLEVVHARRKRLAALLENHRYLPIGELCARLKISEATARRDLSFLSKEKQVTRTYGGALSPFDVNEASFATRRVFAEKEKAQIAQKAMQLIGVNQTCFFDAGTTIYALAKALSKNHVPGLCAVTSSVPIAEILGRRPEVDVHLLGGRFLHRQLLVLGDQTNAMVKKWRFDFVFLGAEGVDAQGLWASDPAVAAFQRVVIKQARTIVICAHAAKINRKTDSLVLPWKKNFRFATDKNEEVPAEWPLPDNCLLES